MSNWDGKTERRHNNSLCQIHSKELRDIWVAIRGNGNPEEGLQWKTQLILERQKPLFDFINGIKKIFWIVLPICLAGALAALGNVFYKIIEFLFKTGRL